MKGIKYVLLMISWWRSEKHFPLDFQIELLDTSRVNKIYNMYELIDKKNISQNFVRLSHNLQKKDFQKQPLHF